MFRATLVEEPDRMVIRLEGSLAGALVKELDEFWSGVRQQGLGGRQLAIDLASISFVSPAGKQLLAHMYQSGAQLIGRGPLTRGIVESIVESSGPVHH